ncbi:MAG: hypothetical protein WCV79_00595 [Candidatus Paceibacterota bacterium]
MLYVFYGTDIGTSQKKARTLVASLRAKKPDASYEEISSDNWSAQLLESHLDGQGLFSSKYIIFLDRVTDNVEAEKEFIDFLPAMKESENIFIVFEGKLLTDMKKAVAKHAEKALESGEKTDIKSFNNSEFNIFSLADAVGSRENMKAWMIYRQAIDRGIEAESILGTLFWQVKSILLASKADGISDSGLSPFVFSKSKRYSANFPGREAEDLLEKIVVVYHDSHRGLVDAEYAIERMLLSK